VIVIGLPEEEDIVLINPEIMRRKGERVVTEGCLSIPGYFGVLKRAESIRVKARDVDGKEIKIKADELLAQALEHEVDHLNGVLYIDHLESPDELYKVEPESVEF
jgi:peptide deformylase